MLTGKPGNKVGDQTKISLVAQTSKRELVTTEDLLHCKSLTGSFFSTEKVSLRLYERVAISITSQTDSGEESFATGEKAGGGGG